MIDIFTPLKSLWQTARGTHKTFTVAQDDQAYTEMALKAAGIRLHNRNLTSGFFVFDVAIEDAEATASALGVPL